MAGIVIPHRMAPMRRILQVLLALAVFSAQSEAAERQVSTGRGGAVAAEDEIATRVGIEILKKGGNAADAAVAVAFALAVTWPEAGNIGGGGFWISRDSKGKVLAVDFREVAPRLARRDLYVKPARNGKVPSSTEGPLASGVPGSVAGLSLAHRRAGHLPWKTLINPAVRLARDGFRVTETFSRVDRPQPRPPGEVPGDRAHLPAQRRASRAGLGLQAARSRQDPRGDPGPPRRRLLPRPGRPGDRGGAGAGGRPHHAGRPGPLRGEGPDPPALPVPQRGALDAARAFGRPDARRDGDARRIRRRREVQAARRLLRAPARRDREAGLSRPQPVPGRPGVPARPAEPPDRPRPPEGDRRLDRPACARRRAPRCRFPSGRNPRRRTSRSWTARAAPCR